jgi:nucleoside-diphosphate-sugar epimerase
VKKKTKTILLIGGGGYIGGIVLKYFLDRGYSIDVIDNFLYGHSKSLKKFSKNNKVSIFRTDATSLKLNKKLSNYENVIILSGLVGDPITKKYPVLAKKFNETSIKKIIRECFEKNVKNLTFVSTCSNYGYNLKPCTETSKLKPLSSYAKSKVAIEKYIISQKDKFSTNAVILRFSTAFGISYRTRFDLTVNQFVKEAIQKKKLVVYDADTWRPYCHVKDFARLIFKISKLKKNKKYFQIYNVGSDKNNYTKMGLVKLIKKYLPNIKVEILGRSKDRRNYKVNFGKINKSLNFRPLYSVEYGIKELINFVRRNKNIVNKKIYYNFYIN